MSNAPFCNVTIATPKGDPAKQVGLQQIPQGAQLPQVIRIINNNFKKLSQSGNFIENRAQRVTTVTRIFDPNDSSVFVDVRQITALQFINPLTGQTVSWKQ